MKQKEATIEEQVEDTKVEGQAIKPTLETNVVKPRLSIFVKDNEDEVEYRLIPIESETQLDEKIKSIEDFMDNNHGGGKTELEKDALYGVAKQLWGDYTSTFKDSKYTFYLNRKQYQFLTTLLRDKLEYDVNTIFFAIELSNMLGTWINSDKHKNDNELKGYTSDATEVTYIYHLIAKHKVKGLTADTYLFAEILKKIGDISKIISYYDTSAKNLSKDIQNWAASFEDGVTVEGKDWGKQTQGIEIKELPKKKAAKSKKEVESE